MDLGYAAEYDTFRREVRAFLAAHWTPTADAVTGPPGGQEARLRLQATQAGYLYRNIPTRYGGSEQPPDILKAQIIREEFARARAPGEVSGIGVTMLVPTLLDCGSDWQKQHFIPKSLTGEYLWAQGYSEPNCGSDLASVRTRAELVAGEWVINGQKIWSSLAQYAHFMFALVRTDPAASSKHAGLSYVLLDLRQPGVTIRPLRQITGGEEFCEVFLEDVRAPQAWMVGAPGAGWQVSKATLGHERSAVGAASQTEALFAKLVQLARKTEIAGRPAIEDAAIRERLAVLDGYVQAHLYSGYRQLSMQLQAQDAGPVTLMNKLVATQIGHEVAKLARELIGDALLLAPGDGGGPAAGLQRWNYQFMGSLGVAIAGGTSNIQRNIIAERGYGLPRDSFAKET
jgi:alkylation response protein AidB-like acyl-CoA dehydrogenase